MVPVAAPAPIRPGWLVGLDQIAMSGAALLPAEQASVDDERQGPGRCTNGKEVNGLRQPLRSLLAFAEYSTSNVVGRARLQYA